MEIAIKNNKCYTDVLRELGIPYRGRNIDTLKTITIPNTVTKIGNSAFEKCDALTNCFSPSALIEIGESAFSNCKSLTEFIVPNTCTTMKTKCFYNCTNLTLTINVDELSSIGSYAMCFVSVINWNAENSTKWNSPSNNGNYTVYSSRDTDSSYSTVSNISISEKTISSSNAQAFFSHTEEWIAVSRGYSVGYIRNHRYGDFNWTRIS